MSASVLRAFIDRFRRPVSFEPVDEPTNAAGVPLSTVEALDSADGAALVAAALRYEFFGDYTITIQDQEEILHAGVVSRGKIVDINGAHDKHDWLLHWKLALGRPGAVCVPVLVSALETPIDRDVMEEIHGSTALGDVVSAIRQNTL